MKNFLVTSFFLLIVSCLRGQLVEQEIVMATYVFHFESAKHDLLEAEHSLVDSVVAKLRSDSTLLIEIKGHTDSKGSDDYNLQLSTARIEAIRSAIFSQWPVTNRLKTYPLGESSPIIPGENREAQENRRVEVVIKKSIQLRKFEGTVADDSTGAGLQAKILLESKYYRDSTVSDNEGRFEIKGPEGEFARLLVAKKNYVVEEKVLKVSEALQKYPLVMKLPRLMPGKIFSFGKIYFYGNKDIVLPRSLQEVDRLYRTLAISDVNVEIRGHVNVPNEGRVGKLTSHFLLSQARALAIYDEMVERGIDPTRMIHNGYGNWEMAYPTAKNEAEMEMNRRVEIKVIDY